MLKQIKDAIPTTKRVVEGKTLRNAILLSLGMSQTTLINRQLILGKPFSTILIDGVSRFVNTIRGALGSPCISWWIKFKKHAWNRFG